MKTSVRLMAIAGILLLLVSLVLAVGETGFGINDGKDVSCTADIDAIAWTSGSTRLDLNSASCKNNGVCSTISPFSILDWFDIPGTLHGELSLLVGGKEYDATDLEEHPLDPTGGSNYGVSACIPKTASQVVLKVTNSNGGQDDTQTITLT